MSVRPRSSPSDIDAWLDEHAEDLVAIRRRIHAHPELSWEERLTTELVAERLTLAGLEPRPLASGTGLVCDIEGRDGLERMAVRADLDALAMEDEKDVSYRSQVPGVAHACGHDVHTTAVLGAALHIAHRRESVSGPVRFIFQPAEERVPGGARDTIADGALDGVGAIIGLHCDPKLDTGNVGIKAGAVSSAADMATIHLSGPGGHTARPERTVDMIPLASRIVQELPRRVADRVAEPSAVRIGFGMLRAGDAANVVPSSCTIRASVRTPSSSVWETLPAALEGALAESLEGSGASYRLEYTHGVPPVVNDEAITEVVRAAAVGTLGQAAVVPTEQSWGGDDFAWYLRERPGAFMRVGVHDPASPDHLDLHAGSFDVDEAAIPVAVRVIVASLARYFAS